MEKHNRLWLPLLLALVLTPCCSPPPPLRVGSDLEHAPFIDTDESGAPRGRDIELIELMASEIGRPVKWVRLPFKDVLPALERGEIDVACATLGITAERARRVDFLSPNYMTDQRAVVREGDGEPVSLTDLAGRRVAASRGTTSELALITRIPDAIAVLDPESELSARERLLSGAIDAVILDGPDAVSLASSSEGVLRVLEEPLAEEAYAFAVNRRDTALREALDTAQASLRQSGRLDELDRRYAIPSGR